MEKEEILLELFKKGRMTYADITRLGYQRTDARDFLDDFIKERQIKEEGRKDWKRGKKLWYSLTAEGKRRLFKSKSDNALEAFKMLKEVIKAVPEADALVILAELESQVRAAIRFDEGVIRLSPKNAELDRNGQGHLQTTGTGEERRASEAFYKRTGGRVQVSIPKKRRLR
jgi:predicted ArsR family transcriptional regulator